MENKNKGFSISKRAKSFSYAYKGIIYVIKNEHNAWIHLLAAILVIGMGFFFNITNTEWCIVILCMGAVFTAEMINSAFEKMVDSYWTEFHKNAEIIKDVAAGAVLVTAIAAACVGIIVFLPYIVRDLG